MTLNQVLCSIWDKHFRKRSWRFEEIVGHTDIKLILNKAILSERPLHVLLTGKPGCAKTMFLTEMMRIVKESCFIVGSNTTKVGLVNQLFEKRPKFLLIDELEKMNSNDQTSLLHLMETGIISETKINKTRQMELTSWVFATANSCQKIMEPLLSRFLVLEIPEYTFEEFREIAVTRLAKENVDKILAVAIADKVWKELGSRDVRDVVKVGRLSDDIQEVSSLVDIVDIMKKHRTSD